MIYHPLTEEIKQLLVDNNCWFETYEHAPVLTSVEAVKVRSGYSLSQGAKALILRIKKKGEEEYKFVMLVVPGDKRFDKEKVQKLLASKDIRFATEEEIAKITNGVKVGGVPPFGNFFNLEVYADSLLFENEKIIFNAGDRSFSIAMLSKDYQRIVNPRIETIV
jgi:prolyl-tRNA editing enzyme YbaK/EbsC (Cys-tRNA(Pro) deacylase)